jgi:hypothetical protein
LVQQSHHRFLPRQCGTHQQGDKVRVRFINGSAMTFFDVRIPGLKMQDLFTQALGINSPWFIKDVSFDNKQLNMLNLQKRNYST